MQPKPKHEQYHDNVISKMGILSGKINAAIEALDFLIDWCDEDKALPSFARSQLMDAKLSIAAALANAQRLADLANPNAPEDLPF